MSDVDEKRIEFVSDTDVNIPIRWKTAATDLRWNNAIAMAVTIARKIDTSNLWDGYLHFRERTGYFKIDETPLFTVGINDVLGFDVQKPIAPTFTEVMPLFYINETALHTTNIVDSMPCLPISLYSTASTVIYIEMTNPIYSSSVNDNINAFEITAIFGGIRYTFNPTSIEINDISRIKLTVQDMGQVSGEVNVLYRSEKGNIRDNITNQYIESFNRAFTYSMTYSEGE